MLSLLLVSSNSAFMEAGLSSTPHKHHMPPVKEVDECLDTARSLLLFSRLILSIR